MQASKPLNRGFAIVLAVVSIWLVAWVGDLIFIRSSGWWFLGLHGHSANTIEQIGLFFMCWTAAQGPAACIAGTAIASSDFKHPLRTTFLTTAIYYLVFSVMKAFHWPWQVVSGLDQAVPVVAYSVSILSLILFSVFIAWFMPRFHRFWQKCFAQ